MPKLIKYLKHSFFPVLVCISILLGSVKPSAASDATIHHENPWFQTVKNYDFALTPAVGAMVGFAYLGAPGAAIGFAVGSLDEVLVRNGHFSKRHLTAGLLGLSLGSTMHLPYQIGEIGGFGLGTLYSTGHANLQSETLGPYLQGAVTGASYAHAVKKPGHMGAAVGTAFAFLDATSKPILVKCLSSATTARVLTPLLAYTMSFVPVIGPVIQKALLQTWLPESVAVIIAALPTNTDAETEGQTDSIRTPKDLKRELEKVFVELTGDDVINTSLETFATYNIGASILEVQLSTTLNQYFQYLQTLKSRLGANNIAAQSELAKGIFMVAAFLVPYVGRQIANGIVAEFQQEEVRRILEDAMEKKLHTGEAPLHLKNIPSIQGDLQQFSSNLLQMSSGITILWQTANAYTSLVHAALLLYSGSSLDIVAATSFFTQQLEIATAKISSIQRENWSQLMELGNQRARLQNDISHKPKLVIHGRNLDYLNTKIEDLKIQQRQLEADTYKWGLILPILQNLKSNGGQIVALILVSQKVTTGSVPQELISVTSGAANSMIDSGNWYLKNAQNIKSIETALSSIKRVLSHVKTPCNAGSSLTRIIKDSEQNFVAMNNMTITIKESGQNLLHVDRLLLKPGRYAVSGKSGSGKTSLLSKVRGVECNGIDAQGEIQFGTNGNSDVYEVTQEDYLPPASSLLEIIAKTPASHIHNKEEILKRVQDLLIEMRIDELGLDGIAGKLDVDAESEWADILSGGQKRKVAIAAMLLQKPNFVILDETFAGLDSWSTQKVQEIIVRELPTSVVLIVDHHASGNNYNGFYNHELFLHDGVVSLRTIQ